MPTAILGIFVELSNLGSTGVIFKHFFQSFQRGVSFVTEAFLTKSSLQGDLGCTPGVSSGEATKRRSNKPQKPRIAQAPTGGEAQQSTDAQRRTEAEQSAEAEQKRNKRRSAIKRESGSAEKRRGV